MTSFTDLVGIHRHPSETAPFVEESRGRLTDEQIDAWNRQSLKRLRLRWLVTLLLFSGVLLASYYLVAMVNPQMESAVPLVLAGATMVAALVILWNALPYNHPPNSVLLLPTFGYGTVLTLFCGLCISLLAGFLFSPRPVGVLAWVPALLYTLARVVDYADGYVARVTGSETSLGAILDIELDGLGILIAIGLAIQYGQLPIWYLPLGLSRQLFIGGIWLRRRLKKPVYELPPSDNRRLIAGFQTGFISVMLWPIFSPPLTTVMAVLFAVPLFLSFGRDWLVVSGVWDAGSSCYQWGRLRFKQVSEGFVPLIARVFGTFFAIVIWIRVSPELTEWQLYLERIGWGNLLPFYVALFLISLIPFALGYLGRFAALMLVGMACLDVMASGLRWSDNVWLLVSAIVVAHAGSGYFALWRPEEWLLQTRFGGRVPEG